MAEYTAEENQELIRDIKDPVRYYRIEIYGTGGESSYVRLTEEQFNYWENIVNEFGEDELINYMINSEDEEFESDNIESIPENADFMRDDDGDYLAWYDAPTQVWHSIGALFDSANIVITEVDSDAYDANVVGDEDIVPARELMDFTDELSDNGGPEIVEFDSPEVDNLDYICQLYSVEKGSFFMGTLETIGKIDLAKLKIFITEEFSGEEIVSNIQYDGDDIFNLGGDTIGKGYSAEIWKTV